ncbi:MAG: HAD-IIIC family phosphatase [Pseudomonadota bacterium]
MSSAAKLESRHVATVRLSEPPDPALDPLVEQVVAAAPALLTSRSILAAIDWRRIPAERVAAMLDAIEHVGDEVPAWLAKSLVIAGHGLPAYGTRRLPPELRLLNALNTSPGPDLSANDIRTALAHLHALDNADQTIVAATAAGLVRAGLPQDAVRLMLAHGLDTAGLPPAARTALPAILQTLPELSLRVAGFSTTHALASSMRPAFAANGWRADITEAAFGEAFKELLAPVPGMNALVLLLDVDGLLPPDWRIPAHEASGLLTQRVATLADALAAFDERGGVPLLVNTLPASPAPSVGLIDRTSERGLARAIELINRAVLDVAGKSHRITVIDAELALADVAPSRRTDPRLWYYGRYPYSSEATRALAIAFARTWRLRRRGPAKVLALDFDNTLWGGVLGDDGIERLACGEDFPGNAYRALQEECLRLKSQGMLLVGLSKNNPDAMAAFDRHPGMVLRGSDFAAVAVNWEPKPANIRRLANELGLGLDSFVFLDDSPHEREEMRRSCPEVAVPELPSDPALRPQWLRRLDVTWPVRLTEEDQRRAEMYSAEQAARALKAGALSHEDYLASLGQRLTVSRIGGQALARAAQMHQRTNQFNLTTRRLDETAIAAIASDASRGLALIGRVVDKFGDHGLVVAATVLIDGRDAVINTLLMSCRVIGREIERAFLGTLLAELARLRVEHVRGDYIATARNTLVSDLYPANGFAPLDRADGSHSWMFELDGRPLPQSRFVTTILED